MMKICNKCGEVKDDSEFYPHQTNLDGLMGSCKACHRQRVTSNKRDSEYFAHKAKRLSQRALALQMLSDGIGQEAISLATGFSQPHISLIKNGDLKWLQS